MAEVRVNPAEVGPRIAAALQAAASALAAPAAITPPVPAGADPVSVAAAGHVATNAATLSEHLAAGITRLEQGAQAVTAALTGYVVSDATGAAKISGHGGAVAAPLADMVLPAVPAIDFPAPPMQAAAAVASLPGDPAVIDDALHGGAAEAGLHTHAESWDAAAQGLDTAASHLQTVGADLSWSGPAGQSLTQRLTEFGGWLSASAQSARSHAQTARDAATQYRQAVNSHPRAEEVRATQQAYLDAVSRASAGDLSAVPQALQEEAKLADLKVQSASAMTTYGQGAGDLGDVNHPGASPQIGQAGAGGAERAAKDGVEAAEDGEGAGDELGGESADELQAGADPAAADSPAGQMEQQLMSTVTQMPSQMAGAVGQALSGAGQQLGQVGQQANQAVSQLGQVLGGPLSSSVSRLGAPVGASVPDLGGGVGGLGAGGGAGGLGDLGGGLGDLGGVAGGGFGAGTAPASLPEQPAAPPPPPAAPTSSPAGVRTSVPGTGMAGGMPMGMMPMGQRGGADGDKELPRNTDWFPDEALVKDEAEVSEAVAGQRRRPRPQET